MNDFFLWDFREEEMRNRKSHHDDCKDQDEVHARMRYQESADGGGDEEDDARGCADESVRLVTRVFGDEDRDQRREGDAANVARDHPKEKQRERTSKVWDWWRPSMFRLERPDRPQIQSSK